MWRISFFLILASAMARAAPFVVSDAVTATPAYTHCGWYVDALPGEVLPVATVTAGGVQCKKDFAGLASGKHTITATHIIKDAAWGNLESPKSVPLRLLCPLRRPLLLLCGSLANDG